ncbi:hypothetical protein WJX84_007140, partial [Apatococcus fuscideae]
DIAAAATDPNRPEASDLHAADQPLEWLRLSALRDYLHWEFADLVGGGVEEPPEEVAWGEEPTEIVPPAPKQKDAPVFNFERVLDDLVLLTFLSGNDFLPNVPSLEIPDQPSSLDQAISAYKQLLPSIGGHITKLGTVNPERLKPVLAHLAKDEEDAFQRREDRQRAQHRRQLAKEADEASWEGPEGFGGGGQGTGQWVSVGEAGGMDNLDLALNDIPALGQGNAEGIDVLTANDKELRIELKRRIGDKLHMSLMDGNQADPVRYSSSGYKARHYNKRFGAELGEDIEKVARKASTAYLQGMSWSFAYYVHGSLPMPITESAQTALASLARKGKGKSKAGAGAGQGTGVVWDWFYPYHYAPLISDLAKYTGSMGKTRLLGTGPEDIEADSWAGGHGPVRPLLQLMAVLPPSSGQVCLPRKLSRLLSEALEASKSGQQAAPSMAAALADMFPTDMQALIDVAGKKFLHTAIVRLPHADCRRLAAAAQEPSQDEIDLTPADEARNVFAPAVLLMRRDHPLAEHAKQVASGKEPAPFQHPDVHGHDEGSSLLAQIAAGSYGAPSVGTKLAEDLQPASKKGRMAPQDSSKANPFAPLLQFQFDLAGILAPPFSAIILPGCKETAMVTQREWSTMQAQAKAADAAKARALLSKANRGRGSQGVRSRARAYGRAAPPPPQAIPRTVINRPTRRGPVQALAWEGPEATEPPSSSWSGDAAYDNTGRSSYGEVGRSSYEPHFNPSEWEPRYGTSAPTAASSTGDVALREQQEALERFAKQRNSSMAAAAAADASASSAYDHFPMWQDPGTENDEEVARRLQAELDASTLQDELIAHRMQAEEEQRRQALHQPTRLERHQMDLDAEMARKMQAQEQASLATAQAAVMAANPPPPHPYPMQQQQQQPAYQDSSASQGPGRSRDDPFGGVDNDPSGYPYNLYDPGHGQNGYGSGYQEYGYQQQGYGHPAQLGGYPQQQGGYPPQQGGYGAPLGSYGSQHHTQQGYRGRHVGPTYTQHEQEYVPPQGNPSLAQYFDKHLPAAPASSRTEPKSSVPATFEDLNGGPSQHIQQGDDGDWGADEAEAGSQPSAPQQQHAAAPPSTSSRASIGTSEDFPALEQPKNLNPTAPAFRFGNKLKFNPKATEFTPKSSGSLDEAGGSWGTADEADSGTSHHTGAAGHEQNGQLQNAYPKLFSVHDRSGSSTADATGSLRSEEPSTGAGGSSYPDHAESNGYGIPHAETALQQESSRQQSSIPSKSPQAPLSDDGWGDEGWVGGFSQEQLG